MQREVIRPNVGESVVVVLDHADGVQREGRYGVDFQYTVNHDSGVMWLPQAGRDALLRVNAQAGDSIELVKQKKGNTYTFTARIVGEQHQVEQQPRPIPARAYYQPGVNGNGNGHVNGNGNGNGNGRAVAPPPAAEQQNDGLLARCLIDAIEALREAEHYGNEHEFEVEFSSEDVRACAITLYLRKVGR